MAREIFRKELAASRPYVPGKPIEEVKREYGIERVEKLASNENPIGPSPLAIEAMRAELPNVNLYPDPSAAGLRLAIAAELGIGADEVVVGNGGEHCLQIVAQTFIGPGDEAIMAVPSFDLYSQTVGLMGGKAVQVPLKGFEHDLDVFLEEVRPATKIVYICNPNNPTGSVTPAREIERFLGRLPGDVVLLIDEAYYEYARGKDGYLDSLGVLRSRPNTIILRTFSKIAGIAGIRVGYLLTSASIASQLGKVRGTFMVNRLAQAAALGALRDRDHVAKTIALNGASMAMMREFFERKGLEYVESSANFIFVNTRKDSRKLFEALMRRGIIVRPGHLWNCDHWLRVSTGTLEQTKAFIEALDALA